MLWEYKLVVGCDITSGVRLSGLSQMRYCLCQYIPILLTFSENPEFEDPLNKKLERWDMVDCLTSWSSPPHPIALNAHVGEDMSNMGSV